MTPYEPGFEAQMQQAERLMRTERNVLRLLADGRPAARPTADAPPPPSTEPK
jgi:hypothetical protein